MRHPHTMRTAIIAAMLLCLAAIARPYAAHAQGCSFQVINNSSCKVELCLNSACNGYGPGSSVKSIPCAFNNTIEATICGVRRVLTVGNCCYSVGVGTGNGCCVDICLTQPSPGSYVVTITPAGPICHCDC